MLEDFLDIISDAKKREVAFQRGCLRMVSGFLNHVKQKTDLERLIKICDYSQVSMNLLLATLLIDEQDSHEYFSHKYNISNNIKDNL